MERDQQYKYRGARALILLHDEEMRRFLETWKRVAASGVLLPKDEDPDYASYHTLLRLVLGASRGYMVWICEQLALADPEIDPAPEADLIEACCTDYLTHVLSRWRDPLREVSGNRFDRPEYASRWNVKYCIDAMLEHAVMHPIRHRFQLEELLGD